MGKNEGRSGVTEADKRIFTAERYKKRRSFSMAGSLAAATCKELALVVGD